MANIQQTLESLQPYVIGIRYLAGQPLVDVVFNDGWTVLDDDKIKKVKGDESLNYYMLYSEIPGIGMDEILAFVDRIIKANLDREKKHDLLRLKVNELKEVFKRNSLDKLRNLKFTFSEDDEFNLEEELHHIPILTEEKKVSIPDEPIEEEIIDEQVMETPASKIPKVPNDIVYLDENKNPIQLSPEDKEMIEEEARAEKNRQAIEARKAKTPKPVGKNIVGKVELPPKRKLEMTNERSYDTDCECGPNEACEKCIDSKY
jgi:hypothetical protein